MKPDEVFRRGQTHDAAYLRDITGLCIPSLGCFGLCLLMLSSS